MKTHTQTPLGEIMATRAGTVDPAQYPNETFDLYSIPAFDQGEPDVLLGQEIGSTKQLVQPGDVLLSKIVPHIRRSWVVGKDRGRRLIASSEWIVFRSEEFHSPYLRHVLTSDPFHVQFMGTVAGVGGSLLRARPAQVAGLSIPLPSLPEQRRIADILDKAEAIRRKRQEAQAELIRLIDSQFLNVFGDPLANPKKWVAGKFDDHLTLVQYGPRFFNEAYSSDGIRIVRITDLDQQGRLEYDAMPRMTVSEKDRESFLLRTGDLLLARSGATVGKTALIDEAAPECIAGAYFIRLRFTDKIRPLFAQMVLRSKPVQTIIAEKSKQSAQQNFNGPAIRALPLPAPPTKLQDEFVAFYKNAIESGKRLLKASNEVDDLFNSLVQRAFRGEL
jgi:type I restriction enzyme S subunit